MKRVNIIHPGIFFKSYLYGVFFAIQRDMIYIVLRNVEKLIML